MAVATAWKRQDMMGNTRMVTLGMTYGSGDTSVVAETGLRKIYSYMVSQYSVTSKALGNATVAGGAITLTVVNPLATAYVTITALGQ